MKNLFKDTTISKRIFIPIMSLIFLLFAMIIFVFCVFTVATTMHASEVESFQNTVNVNKNYIESMMSNKWSNISVDVEQLELSIGSYLDTNGITVDEFLEDEAKTNDFLLSQADNLADIIPRNQVCVSYLVFDNSKGNQDKTSVFLYSMNPELAKKNQIDVVFSSYSIVQYYYQNGYGIGSNAYSMSYKDLNDKSFYESPYANGIETNETNGCWTTGLALNGQNLLTYSLPLFVKGKVVAVLGIGITQRYLANCINLLTKGTEIQNYSLIMVQNDEKKLVFSDYSDYSLPDMSKVDIKSTIYSDVYSFNKGRTKEFAYASSLRLSTTLEYNSEFIFYGISSRSDVFYTSRVALIQMFIIFGIGYVITFLALAAVVKYVSNPIRRVSKGIADGEIDTIPKTGIKEVDVLLDNISKYYDAGIELQAEKLGAVKANEAKTAFLFSMSHDIRTPMNAIVGFAKLLEKHQDNPEKRKEYISKIQDSSQVLLSLINNVLEMARIEAGKIEVKEKTFDFKQFTTTIENMFNGYVTDKNIQLSSMSSLKHSMIQTDEVMLREIYTNIISNAFKYTHKGGTITLTYEEYEKENNQVDIVFTCADTGIGMSEDFLPHLYDEFSRASSTTMTKIEGTGLGMSIVKKYVDYLGGTIEVNSKVNQGTTFRVSIPVTLNLKLEEEKKEEEIIDVTLEGKRILLAEDNDINAEIAVEILHEEGIIVYLARDGKECVEMLESQEAGFFDLILMDVQMPVMNGYQASKAIRAFEDKEKASIPIIAMTANAFEEDKRDAKAAGMDGHLAKPINVDVLFQTLKKILSGKSGW